MEPLQELLQRGKKLADHCAQGSDAQGTQTGSVSIVGSAQSPSSAP